MATTVDVTVEIKDAASRLMNFQRKKLPNAVKRSANKAIKGGKTDTRKLLAKRITMPSRKIGDRIKITQARGTSIGTIKAKLTVRPKNTKEFANLGSFKIQKVRKSIAGKRRLSPSGVGAKVWGEKKFKKYRGAFVWSRPGAISGSAAVTVFKRVKNAAKVKPGKRTGGDGEIRTYKTGPKKGQVIKRQPIEPVYGASVTREFIRGNRKGQRTPVIDLVRVSIRARFVKELNRLIERL